MNRELSSLREKLQTLLLAQRDNATQGKVADYIPALAKVKPELMGAAIATIDGDFVGVGDRQEMVAFLAADGIHLTTERLSHFSSRPIPSGKFLSCACHNTSQLKTALTLQADMATYSPVQETESHPGIEAIGWQAFHDAIEYIPMPVYALGGLGRSDIRRARGLGGQGVAGIRAFWPQHKPKN